MNELITAKTVKAQHFYLKTWDSFEIMASSCPSLVMCGLHGPAITIDIGPDGFPALFLQKDGGIRGRKMVPGTNAFVIQAFSHGIQIGVSRQTKVVFLEDGSVLLKLPTVVPEKEGFGSE